MWGHLKGILLCRGAALLFFFAITHTTAWGQQTESRDLFRINHDNQNVGIEIAGRRHGPFAGIESVHTNSRGQFAILLQNDDRSFSVLTNEQLFGPWRHPDAFGWIWMYESGVWSVKLTTFEGTTLLIVNGKEEGTYHDVTFVAFSPDGRRWMAAVQDSGGLHSLVGPGPPPVQFREIKSAALLQDGSLYAHVIAIDGNEYMLAGGNSWGPMEVFQAFNIHGTPYWAFYGSRRRGRETEYIVVVNGKVYEGESLRMTLQQPQKFTWISYEDHSSVSRARFHTFTAPR